MTKRKTTATGLSKTSGQDGKPSAVLPVGYFGGKSNMLTNCLEKLRAHLAPKPWQVGGIRIKSKTPADGW
jgi:hypothetical protein